MPRSPNIIICMCDQLRAMEVGCYGHPMVRTPNIDNMARQGVRFETAVSNNPVCMPARSIVLSGQHARTCMGSLGNVVVKTPDGEAMPSHPWPGRPHLPDPTLPELLRAGGYHTAAIGKWHIHSTPADIGFDYSLIPRVQHRHTGQHYTENGEPDFLVEGFSPQWESQRVGQFLAGRANHSDQPFFLYYNISPPHMPLFDAPDQYLSMYDPRDVPLRPNVWRDGQLFHNERWFRVYLWDFVYYVLKEARTRDLPPGFDLRRLIALYHGMTTWVDDLLGSMMRSLGDAGLDRDTIVLFASDHGDMLGSHHLMNKGQLLEESIRVPMIWRWPASLDAAVAQRQVASLLDIAPTLLDLAGVQASTSHMQGHSLAPVLRGEADELPDNWAIIETAGDGLGIRTPTHLLGMKKPPDGRDPPQPHRFHDLQADPWQQQNLAARSEQSELRQRLAETLEEWDRRTVRAK